MSIDISNNVCLDICKEVQKICTPIFKMFDLNFFRYLRVYYDGSRINLCNNSDWTLNFYMKNLYHVAWFDAFPLEIKKCERVIWDERAKIADNVVGESARNIFDIFHGISILKPNKNYYESYEFATKQENKNINIIYMKQSWVFERFILYFKSEAQSLIKLASKSKIIPEDILERWLPINNKVQEENHNYMNDFLHETKIEKYYIDDNTYLTRKEMECIYWAAQGKSSEEISLINHSSKKTVETHLSSIKQKMGLYKLIRVINTLNRLGILDCYNPNY